LVVVDCDFDAVMSRGEGASLGAQLVRAYAAVRRAPGGRPGAVTLAQEEVLMGRPQEGRDAARDAGEEEPAVRG
jgi:hypothetical protein